MTETRRYRAVLVLLLSAPTALGQLTAEQWRQDLKVLAMEMPRLHKNLFFQLPRSEFERQVSELDTAIPKLDEIGIRAGLVRLLASVGNAHTAIRAFQNTPYFPIQFEIFPDGVYVTAASGHPEAVGARVVAVDGTPIDQVRQRLLPYFAKENDVAALTNIPWLLCSAAALRASGVIGKVDTATYTLDREKEWKLALGSSLKPAFDAPEGVIMRRSEAYWFEYRPESKAMYVQYNECKEAPGKPFKDFAKEVMDAARSNPVERFLIDLRFNGGGDSRVIAPLTTGLQSWKGHVFALVGRYTFSSAFMAAEELREKCHARLVGEAMGQRPNSYGDIRPLKLPNSGLTAFYCTKYFRRSQSDVPQVEPDIPVPVSAKDYFAGRDPVLEYALRR